MSSRDVKQVWKYEAPSISPSDFSGNQFQSGNWEHSLDSFFRDCTSLDVWSATQMKATKKHLDNFPQSPQPKHPRVRNPWPILMIRKPTGEEQFLNKPDGGCNHEAKELAGPDECRCKTCLTKDDGNKSSGGEAAGGIDNSADASKAEAQDSAKDSSPSSTSTPEPSIEGPPPILDAEPKSLIADGSSTSISATEKLSEDVSPVLKLVEGDSPSDATQRCQPLENPSNAVNTMGPDGLTHQDALDVTQAGDKPSATKSEDAALDRPSLDHPVSPCDIPLPLDTDEDSDGKKASVNPIEPASVAACEEPSIPSNSLEPISSASDCSADIVPPNVLEHTLCSEVKLEEDKTNCLESSSAGSLSGIVTSVIPLQQSPDVTTTPSSPGCAQRDDCHIVDSNVVLDFGTGTGIIQLTNLNASWSPHLTKDKDGVEVNVHAVMTPFSSDDSLSLSGGDFSSDHSSQATPRATPHELEIAINGLDTVETAPLLLSPSGSSDATKSAVTEEDSNNNTPQLDNMALTSEGDVVLSDLDKQEVLAELIAEVRKSNVLTDLSKQECSTPSSSPEQKPLNTEPVDGSADDRTPIESPISEKEQDESTPSQRNVKSEPKSQPANTVSFHPSSSKDPALVESLQATIEATMQPSSPQSTTPVAESEATTAQPAALTPTDESLDLEVVGELVQDDAVSANLPCGPKVLPSSSSTLQSSTSDPQAGHSTTSLNTSETSVSEESDVTGSPRSDNKSAETSAQLPCSEVESIAEPAVVPEPPKKELPSWNTRLIAQQFPFFNSAEVPYEEYRNNSRAMVLEKLPFFTEDVIPPLYKTFKELQNEMRAKVSAELPFFEEYFIPPLYKTFKELQDEIRAKVFAELPFFQEFSIPPLYKTPNRSHFEGPQYDPLYIKDLPKLEEFIPEQYLPDTLIVHDSDQVTGARAPRKKSYIYCRKYPKLPSTMKGRGKIGHIYLGYDNKLGSGHWSNVYKASFKLPSTLTAAHSPNGHVIVAAKLHDGGYEAKNHLKNEGMVYSQLPESLMQDYCGYATFPHKGNPSCCRNPVPLGPVVPKFYGYYVPEGQSGSPILLLEHCGKSLAGRCSSVAEKEEVISLYARLHDAGFVQGSAYRRNMLVQAGPLTVAPELRCMDTPSYRLIDFGRGEVQCSSREGQCEYEYAVDHVFHYTEY